MQFEHSSCSAPRLLTVRQSLQTIPKNFVVAFLAQFFTCLEHDDFKNVLFHRVLFKLKQDWLQNLLSITYQEKS